MKLTVDSSIYDLVQAVEKVAAVREDSYNEESYRYEKTYTDALVEVCGNSCEVGDLVTILAASDYAELWDFVAQVNAKVDQ